MNGKNRLFQIGLAMFLILNLKLKYMFYTKKMLGTIFCVGVGTAVSAQTSFIDPKIKKYEKVPGTDGRIDSIGSDTLNNLMTLWSESFRKVYPNVRIQIEGKGSSTAPPALIEGTAQFGPMSRPMKKKEMESFEKKYGFPPTAIGVALDALAIFVHKDNPLQELSFPQIDAIFSSTRRGGFSKNIETWGDLGLKGAWKNRAISLYGRNSASGTYGYFKSKALFKGDYKNSVKEQPGSASVVQSIAKDLGGIGYSGMGYQTSGVRVVPLSKKHGQTSYQGTYQNVVSQKYPLSRMLLVYIVKEPGKPLSPVVKQFLTFILSREGQKIVEKDGYLPLPSKLQQRQLGLLK